MKINFLVLILAMASSIELEGPITKKIKKAEELAD
jgi:hypothetical protein